MKSVDFYFDFGSPTAYIAYKVLPRITEKAGAALKYKPILLGGIFKATGNASPVTVAAKGRYMGSDIPRFAEKYGVPYNFNPNFPINTLALMRGAAAYQDEDKFASYLDAVFDAMWLNEKDMNDPEVAGAVLAEAGFDPAEFMARVGDQAVKDKLMADTEAAVERGLFGAPTMFVGDDMFWGQDRLHFVAEALGVNICDVVPDFIKA